MRLIVFLLVLFVVIAATLLLATTQTTNKDGRVCIEGTCFSVNVSVAPAQLETGLMGVSSMSNDSGMLFVLPGEGVWPFWMKGMEIPLDIIWIDNGSIVFIANESMPCNSTCPLITPNRQANYVLEINSGLSSAYGFAVGEEVNIKK